MTKQNTVENSVKVVQNLPFDVVAVPQNNTSPMLDTGTVSKPVNIKIRVRNKEETGGHGVISVPKLSTSGPKKVRLVSSDQTIISFDLYMEKENVKKVPKKSHYKFLQLFKPSGCFNNQNEDDVYPYIPSSSNDTYRAKSASDVNDLQDDKIYEEKFALKKNLPEIINNTTTLRTPTFLGKCKPGGCLDPPFGEDKYIYKPQNKMITFDQNNIEKNEYTDKKNIKDKTNTDKIIDNSESVLPHTPSKSSIEEDSHSLITYPLALSSSETHGKEEIQSNKPKIRTSNENKSRLSINEFTDTYFMPPRKQKIQNNEKLDTEFQKSQILRSDSRVSRDTKTDISLISHKELTPLSPMPNELFNLAPEAKISCTDVHDTKHKWSEMEPLKVDTNKLSSKLSNTNIESHVLKEKNSISDDNVSDPESLLIHKDTTTKEHLSSPTRLGYYQALKDESISNKILNNFKPMHMISDSPLDNQSLASQGPYKLPIENQALKSIYLNTKSNKMETPTTPTQEYNSNNNKKIGNYSISDDDSINTESLLIHKDTRTKEDLPSPKQDYQALKGESSSNEIPNNLKLMQLISDDAMDSHSQASQGQLQSPVENQALKSIYLNTDANMMETLTQDNKSDKDERNSIEILKKFKLPHEIPDEPLNNHSLASEGQYKLQPPNDTLKSSFINTDENEIKINTDIDIALTDYLPETENLQQVSFTESANETGYSQLSLNQKKQNREKINAHHKDLQQNRSSQDVVKIFNEEKSHTINLFGKEDADKIENKYLDILTLNTDEKQPVHQKLIQLSSEDLTNIINAEPNFSEKRKSMTAADLKRGSNIILGNIDSNKEALLFEEYSLQEKSSSTLLITEKDRIHMKTNNLLNPSDSASSPSDYLEEYKSGNVIQELQSIDPVELQSLENLDADDRPDLFTKDIKSIDKEALETGPRLQSNNTKISLASTYIPHTFISHNEKPNVYDSRDTMVTIDKKLDHTEILLDDYPDFDQKSLQLNILKNDSANSKEALVNDDKNNLIKPGEENVLRNKNSLIEINLGFHTIQADTNETMIKTFDTSKDMEIDSHNKITIIKTIIRKTDSAIRIPINSEMDLILQIKKTFDKVSGSITKTDIDDTKQESTIETTLNKDILLQETLDSVYENLVPVENMIRNLKEEAESLTQQQVVFREILNSLKTRSVIMTNTSKKCTCNNYLM